MSKEKAKVKEIRSSSSKLLAHTFTTTGDILNINDYIIGDQGINEVCRFLKANMKIKHLNISGNNLTYKGFSTLLTNIEDLELTTITAEWNFLGSEKDCFEIFTKFYSKNSKLTELNLQNNKISTASCKSLSKLLSLNIPLQRLNLKWNEIDSDGANLVIQSLKENQNLIDFDIGKNRIDFWFIEEINKILERNKARKARSKYLDEIPIEEKRVLIGDSKAPLTFLNTNGQVNFKSIEEIIKNERSSFDQLKDRLETEIEIEKSNRHKLEDIIISKESEILRMQEEFKLLKKETNSKAEKIHILNAKQKEQEIQISLAEKESKELKNELLQIYQISNNEIGKVQEENEHKITLLRKDYQSQVEILQEQINLLKNEKDKLNTENSLATSKLEKIKILYGLQFGDDLAILEEGKAKYEKEINSLKEQLREKEGIIFDKEREVITLQEKDNATEDRISQIIEELKVLKDQTSELFKNLGFKKSENSKLMCDLQILMNDLKAADDKIMELENDLSQANVVFQREKDLMNEEFDRKAQDFFKEKDFMKIRITQLEKIILEKDKELARQIGFFQQGIENLHENVIKNKTIGNPKTASLYQIPSVPTFR